MVWSPFYFSLKMSSRERERKFGIRAYYEADLFLYVRFDFDFEFDFDFRLEADCTNT